MDSITLTLDAAEALALRDVLDHVGGSRTRSRRGHLDRVYADLVVQYGIGEPLDIDPDDEVRFLEP